MGALIATYFAERGAKVVLSARNEARLQVDHLLVHRENTRAHFHTFSQHTWRCKCVFLAACDRKLRVLLLIKSPPPASITQTLKNQLPCPAAHASVVPVDLCGSFQGLEKASQAAMQAFDGLDYVVHCVGAWIFNWISRHCFRRLFGCHRYHAALLPLQMRLFMMPALCLHTYTGASMNALAAEVTPEVTGGCMKRFQGGSSLFSLDVLVSEVLVNCCCQHRVRLDV